MSIQHFSALSKKRRQEFVENPGNFTCQEKMDGSNFIIGLDEEGFWTSRKNGKEKYRKASDWGFEYWATHFREAHIAVTHFAHGLRRDLGDKFELHCELLSSYYPNTIEYGKVAHSLNESYHNIGKIVVYAGNTSLKTSIHDTTMIDIRDIPYTLDGVTTQRKSGISWWLIENLGSTSFLRYIPNLATTAEEQQEEYLLENLVRTRTSAFSNVQIEGLVFEHKTDKWSFKLVDKAFFTKQNTENYAVRKQLFKTPGQKTNSVTDIYCRNVANGMAESEAKELARQMTLQKLCEYLDSPLATRPSIHRRNLEAFAALHEQFS